MRPRAAPRRPGRKRRRAVSRCPIFGEAHAQIEKEALLLRKRGVAFVPPEAVPALHALFLAAEEWIHQCDGRYLPGSFNYLGKRYVLTYPGFGRLVVRDSPSKQILIAGFVGET